MQPDQAMESPLPRTRRRRPISLFAPPVLITIAVFGWLTLLALGATMYAHNPPSSGFDLELLLVAGRHVAAGATPYDATLLAGGSVEIQTLFYTYPPFVAQVLSLVAAIPSGIVIVLWGAASLVAFLGTSVLLARAIAPGRRPSSVVLAAAALAVFWFPYSVGLLFANLDIFFPALYGLVLLAAMETAPARAGSAARTPTRSHVVLAGVALALAASTKLYPALLGLWFLARGIREWRSSTVMPGPGRIGLPPSWAVCLVAGVTVAAIAAASLVVGGLGPWQDYLTVLRASSGVDLLDGRNLGPAVQVALALGLGPSAVGPLQTVVLGFAVVVTVVAALRIADPLESLTWAALASFVPLPVTWFHHFGALMPFGLAALLRTDEAGEAFRRRTRWLIAAAYAITTVGFGIALTWLVVPVAVLLARWSAPRSDAAAVPATATA